MHSHKEGDIFEVVHSGGAFSNGSIIILSKDDRTDNPLFDLVKGDCGHSIGRKTKFGACISFSFLKKLWPLEKQETVELNGKSYLKSEIEEALKHLKPVGE